MNLFKVGDKVKIKEDPYGIFSRAGFKPNTPYTVNLVDRETDRLYLKETLGCIHYTHLDFYKEEKDMTPQTTQQTQQKTKRVPFTHELWEKWKDKGGKVFYKHTGKEVLQFAYFPEADYRYRYVYLTTLGGCTHATDIEYLELLIPITTKRVPFDPELKDVKVFTTDGNQSVVDWAMFKDGQVACQWPNQYMGYYPTNYLEMEIEEDV